MNLFEKTKALQRAGWLLALLAAWCPSGQAESRVPSAAGSGRVWPSAPAEPRITFVESIYTPGDLGLASSGWTGFGKWLTGQDKKSALMVKPQGIAVDESGNICVTDMGANCVCLFDTVHHKFHRWTSVGKLSFQSPVSVAKSGDLLYVADSALGSVIVFDISGKLQMTITNGLARPAGLAIAAGRMLVADSKEHRVSVFDLRGNLLFQFGHRGTEPGEFNFPTHLAVDSQGGILVTDSMNERIQMFDSQGKFLAAIGSAGDAAGHFTRPKGVAADSFGHIYVVDAMFDNMQVFDRAGQFLLDIGSSGSSPGDFWLPSGIAIGRDNRIYVADSYNRRIEVFKYIGPP